MQQLPPGRHKGGSNQGGGDGCGGRAEKAIAALNIELVGLQSAEIDQLRSLVTEFADLFALNNSELGRTYIAVHEINTGDSPPLRQPPRRIPFALRSKVNSLVEDMLHQRVITPSSSPWASLVVLVGPPGFVWTTGDLMQSPNRMSTHSQYRRLPGPAGWYPLLQLTRLGIRILASADG